MNYENLLKDRRIGLAVTASVSIYKALDLVRLYKKAGADVRVVMSEEAKKFISPIMFESLSGHVVLHSETESWASEVDGGVSNHIGLAKWAEVFVVAPASANTIAKLANAIADNLMLQTLLASTAPKVLAPAANTNMIEHPITKANIKMLRLCGYDVVDSVVKMLACGDEGKGALANVDDIFLATARTLLAEEFWTYRNVIVTGGGTAERLDDVRYIGNFSSGKMADSLALALYIKGAHVKLLSSKSALESSQIDVTYFESGAELDSALKSALHSAQEPHMSAPTLLDARQIAQIKKRPYVFMAAAVGDFVPSSRVVGKMKKSSIGGHLSLDLCMATDILAGLDKRDITTIGFKAEMDADNAYECARGMLESKGVDAVCLNILNDDVRFGGDMTKISFITKQFQDDITLQGKLQAAFKIVENAQRL